MMVLEFTNAGTMTPTLHFYNKLCSLYPCVKLMALKTNILSPYSLEQLKAQAQMELFLIPLLIS